MVFRIWLAQFRVSAASSCPRCEGGLMLPRMPPKRIRETSAPGPASRTPGLSFCPRPLAQRLCPRPRTKALHKAFGQGSILGTGSLSCKSGQETWPRPRDLAAGLGAAWAAPPQGPRPSSCPRALGGFVDLPRAPQRDRLGPSAALQTPQGPRTRTWPRALRGCGPRGPKARE